MTATPPFDGFDRRTMLKATAAGLAIAPLAGCTGGADDSVDFGGWFDGVANFDGAVDKTGADRVEVTVGAKGNDGNFAFAPAAVTVSAGTTVVWTWNGKGGMHNVAADDGSFESEMLSSAGATFEYTFEQTGIFKYVCEPHEAMGMKGAVVVE